MRTADECAGHWPDHLERHGGRCGIGEAFAKGRDFAAWLGLVPKQMSTGDRTISLARYRSAVTATCVFCSCKQPGWC